MTTAFASDVREQASYDEASGPARRVRTGQESELQWPTDILDACVPADWWDSWVSDRA